MAGLVDTFARRTAVTQPTRFNSAVGSSAAGDDGGGFWDGLKGIGDALGGITGQQGSGRSANGNSTSGGSAYAGSPNSMNTGPAPSIPTRTYTRNNADQIMPALFDANNTLALNNARIDGNIAMLMNNQAARNAGFANSESAYKNQLAGQIANANLDIQGFDIQQANYPQWYKFLAEKWGNAMTAGKADLDYIAKQQVNSATQRLIDWREIQQGKKEVEQQTKTARRDATSAAVVGGVIQNAAQDYGDIDQARGNALYGLDLADQKSQLSEKQRREELSNRRSQLIADLTDFDINTREGQAKLREREQLLGIEAQKARMQPRMLQDAMNVTLANLGLDKVMSQGQFLESLANADAQKQAALNQYLQEAGAWLRMVETWQSTVPGASRVPGPNPSAGKPPVDRQGFR